MDDNTRDFLMWKNGRGRYAAGKQHHGAKTPQEGGIFSSQYSGAVNASRPQAAAIEQSRELMPEPEALEADTMPYAPPRMERIPGESENAPDEAQAVQDFPEMKPEAEAEPARAYFYKMDERSGIIR